MATGARERLMRTATELFYAEGIRAVGVERLLSESGVGRASFYRHFQSKDDLVDAMFREYDHEYRTWLRRRVADLGGDPLHVFDSVAEHAERTDYRGCAFINAMAEFSDVGHPVHALGMDHKRAVQAFFEELLIRAGHRESNLLARQMLILVDGATVTASHQRSSQPIVDARGVASILLRSVGDDAAVGS